MIKFKDHLIVTIILLVNLVLSSCVSTERVSKDFLYLINKPIYPDSQKINYNGFYTMTNNAMNTYAKSFVNGKVSEYYGKVYLQCPLIFYENGFVSFNPGIIFDSVGYNLRLADKYYTDKYTSVEWGVYEVCNDTINAIIFSGFRGPSFGGKRLLQTHYQGILLNNSVVNWRVIAPFPKIGIRKDPISKAILSGRRNPVNLTFKLHPLTNLIDPNNAWINKYRGKKYLKRIK